MITIADLSLSYIDKKVIETETQHLIYILKLILNYKFISKKKLAMLIMNQYVMIYLKNRATIIQYEIWELITYPNDKRVKLYNLSVLASEEIERFFSDFLEITNKKKST